MNDRSAPPRAGIHDNDDPAFPWRTFAALWASFWLMMIVVRVEDQLHNPLTRWWEPVLWEGSSALAGTVWMALAVHVHQRYVPYLDKPLVWFGRYLRWFPLVAASFVTAVYGIRLGTYAAMGLAYEHPSWGFVYAYESIRLAIFTGLWLGILFGIDSYRHWQRQRHRLVQTQKALAEAQLARLQGQLRPHFLFNALNTVSALMHTDVAGADRLVATLGDLLRISLRSIDNEMTPLAEELRALQLYADIMCERYRDRVTLDWRVDRTLLDMPVPVLMLQPLVENAFKHGVERTAIPVRIRISVQRGNDALDIGISNSGCTLGPEQRDGMGLRNCRERLGIIYGDEASLWIHNEDGGVVTRVSIPLTDAMP